jgi:hypothetical protein
LLLLQLLQLGLLLVLLLLLPLARGGGRGQGGGCRRRDRPAVQQLHFPVADHRALLVHAQHGVPELRRHADRRRGGPLQFAADNVHDGGHGVGVVVVGHQGRRHAVVER